VPADAAVEVNWPREQIGTEAATRQHRRIIFMNSLSEAAQTLLDFLYPERHLSAAH
jgi:hypothetical protein